MGKIKIKLIRCPKCKSGQTYYRMQKETYFCRVCGEEFKKRKGT